MHSGTLSNGKQSIQQSNGRFSLEIFFLLGGTLMAEINEGIFGLPLNLFTFSTFSLNSANKDTPDTLTTLN